MDSRPSLAICFPTWNRGDLFQACFSSLLQQLDGIEATIWIFDNGSRAASRGTIERLNTAAHKVIKVYFPENMGLPYVVNCFCQLVVEGSDYAGHRVPEYVMLADADAYFTAPVRDMVEVLESDGDYGVVSGHDSEEHEALRTLELEVRGQPIQIKEKENERGLSLILRTEELRLCYPFPHDTKYNVDWELMKHDPNSLANRKRKVVAVDYVTHLGLYDSTWSVDGVPAGVAEITEINEILKQLGLLTPARQAKIKKHLRLRYGAVAPDSQEGKPTQNLVLGMHRSGTSVLTRLLNLMGCQVGPREALLGSNEDNPHGFWERADVLQLNQKLLACFGADAYHVGHLEPEALAGDEVSELEAMGRRILERFEPDRSLVLKDPRLCLVLGFWRRLLTTPCCVLIYRSPMEVARSLKARDGLPLPYGIALWEKYNLAALEQSRGLPRVLVAHRDLMLEPVQTVAFLYRELVALGQGGLQMLTEPEIEACIDPGLYRKRCDGAIEGEYLNTAQARLLEALRSGDALGWSEVPPVSREAREILTFYAETIDLQMPDRTVGPALRPGRWETELRSRLEALVSGNQDLGRRLDGLERRSVEASQQNEEVSRRLDATLERLARREAELRQLQQRSQDEIREVRERLAARNGELQQARWRLQDETRLRAFTVDTLQKKHDRLETELRQTKAALADRAATAAMFERRLKEAELAAAGQLAAIAKQEGWIMELNAVITAIFDSRSWRLGSACREWARRLLLRPRKPLASDHRREIMRRFDAWRHAEPTSGSRSRAAGRDVGRRARDAFQ